MPTLDHLLEGLNPAQAEAVTTETNPLCILAGAGSGKTRVLTRRIAHRVLTGSAEARHVVALTFTRKAAGELGSRLAAVGVRDQVVAGTFHAIAYAQLRRRWADRGDTPPALLDRKVRLLAPLLTGEAGKGSVAALAADVAGEIEWAKARLISPDHYESAAELAGRTSPLTHARVGAKFRQYEEAKRKRGVVDFDDLLALCAAAIEADSDFAAAQRWRFRHLFVDEFQDVNPAQFRLLQAWLGDNRDLCVVGDPNQAIYSWNGADPTLLTRFERRFRGAATVSLQDNYRSTPQILATANAVLADGGPRSAELRANVADGATPTVTAYDSDDAESKGVASRIRTAHRPGTSWGRIAVLTRTNAQLVLFEQALRAARIPYRIRGGGSLLDQPEVRDALESLRRSRARTTFDAHIADLDLMATEAVDDRQLNLEELSRLAREYAAADSGATVDGFRAWLAATVKPGDTAVGADAVELTTFHRAKGLEWPVVFVAGLEKGLAPIGRATTPEAEAEERRLVYVALTRAREELHCSWAERRTFGARTVNRSASPYLEPIEIACRALQSGQTRPDVRALLAAERSRLRSLEAKAPKRRGGAGSKVPVAGADADLFEALKSWRATAAKAANVPAYVVFHDSTLAAVAAVKPRSHTALLDVQGLGPVKAARYGDALLEVVSRHTAA